MNLEPIHVTLDWIFKGGISLLVALNMFWLRRFITTIDAFTSWRTNAQEKEGGFVTRSKHFEWCKDMQSNCSANHLSKKLDAWQEGILEEGGSLTKESHSEICKQVGDIFAFRMKEALDHNRELLTQELRLVRSEISRDILTGITDMKRTIMSELQSDGGRKI